MVVGLLPIIVLTFCFSILIKKFILWYQDRRRIIKLVDKLPGDNGLPIIGNLLDFKVPPEEILDKTYDVIVRMNDNNWPVMKLWIGPYVIIYMSLPEVQKVILDSSKEITKGSTYDLLKDWLKEGLITGSGDKWRQRRKLISPNFHFKKLIEFHVPFNEESKVLVDILDEFKDTGKEIEVLGYMKRCLFDMIMRTAFGHKLRCQLNPDDAYLHAVEGFCEMAYLASVNIVYKNRFLLYLSGNGFKKDKYLKVLRNFADNLISEKYKEYVNEKKTTGGIKHNSFISMMFEQYENNEIDMNGMREEVDSIVFGGFDTSSSTMAWLLWCLATHQNIQEKVYEEIFDIFGEDERNVTNEDINKMPYFDMVFKEVLRRFSIVSIMTRRLQNDVTIQGYTIPKGVDVVVGPFMSNMNPRVFPDPYKFDPDRFLPENSANRTAFDYIPFSAGPRNCIGQKYAYHNVRIISIWVLRKFRVRSDRPFDYIKMSPQIVTNSDKGFPIIFDSRY
uniref:Cytochrome P450 n=1 Tax=Parastrongyloides trichosuri TaxID=131310 RepID=A0A0N5A5P1_PARTI